MLNENMSEISKLTKLRKLMLEMERSMGLQDLSAVERDIYYAETDLSDALSGVKTANLLDYTLVVNLSRSTFFERSSRWFAKDTSFSAKYQDEAGIL